MISKIYPDGNGGYTRKILSLIEVKRDGSTSEDAIMQLVRYIELAGDQSHDERRVAAHTWFSDISLWLSNTLRVHLML